MRKRIILAALLATSAVLLWLLYNYSYLKIDIAESVSGDVAYSILNQKDQKETTITNSSRGVKKLVRRGSYEVLLTQNETTYFSLVKAGGFMTTNTIRASLEPERSRQFVGNNPGSCTHYSGRVLLSFSCYTSVNNMSVHVPASEQQASHTKRVNTALTGTVQGFIRLGDNDFVFVQSPPNSEDQGPPHALYTITNNGEIGTGVEIQGLLKERLYSIHNFRDGFLVHDTNYRQVMYYSSPSAQPSVLNINRPSDQEFLPYSLSVAGNSVLIAFTNAVHDGIVDIHDVDEYRSKTEIVIQGENVSRNFSFNGRYGHIRLCGSQKLCMVDMNKHLNIYDVSGSKPKKLFAVTNIESMENIAGQLVLVRNSEIIGFDVDKNQGSLQYSFAEYDFCGITSSPGGYVLCVKNPLGYKQALLIETASTNSSSIDKKILKLLKLPQIKDVSIYKRLIHLTPELGEKQYIPEIRGFGYTQDTKDAVNGLINQEINRVGIDRNSYTILNPFDR